MSKGYFTLKRLFLSAFLATTFIPAYSQTVAAPGMAEEASGPFSWYLLPSDEIGFKDSPQAFQLTYDGALNNGFGELRLTTGSDNVPLNNRVRTFLNEYVPTITYRIRKDHTQYDVMMFGAPSDLDPRENLVAYIRIQVLNYGDTPLHTTLRAAYGPRGNTGRSDLACRKWFRDKFMDAAAFQKDSGTAVRGGEATKNGHLIYAYSGTPSTNSSDLSVKYNLDLNPGKFTMIYLKVPFVPIDLRKNGFLGKFRSTGVEHAAKQVGLFWTDLLRHATEIDVPDEKVAETVKASLEYDLMARDVEADGRHFTQTVNKFQYHDFYMRDTSFIARSYEMMNLPEVARTTVEHYLVRDQAGKVTGFLHNAPDDWGQSLWAVGSYLRTCGDSDFAKEIAPALRPHLDDFEKAVASDPLGLWPVAGPYDNELVNGHYTSHNLWALLGLREAEHIGLVAGDFKQASRARLLYAQFYPVFMKRLAAMTSKAQGYIPPGMDDPDAGYDWENASGGVYPFLVLPPDHPWVTATLNMERDYKYREGIMTWGPNAWVGKQASDQGKPFDPLYLHDYDTFQVTEALLARGEQRKVVEDLYSTLVHTSSTHAGFETGIRPWDNRDPDGNYPPHGWFAARFNELVRNMLVREDGETLHLASALAPDWVAPGQSLGIWRGATNFGLVDMTIKSHSDGADIVIEPTWRTEPKALIFHIPWFVKATRVEADGKRTSVLNGQVSVPATTKHLSIRWTWTEHPDLSYANAVKLWLHKAYEPNKGEDRDHLFP